MSYILKNTSGLINTTLTDVGRQKLAEGRFEISYFQIGDSEVSYDTLPSSYNQANTNILKAFYNSQNASGAPQSNKQNVKYPYYVDGITGNTYGIPYMDSLSVPIYNAAAPRGFFSGDSVNNKDYHAFTNNSYVINSNYVVDLNSISGSNVINLIYKGCNPKVVREPKKGDIITIYYDGFGEYNCVCPTLSPTPTPTPSATPCNQCKTYNITADKFGSYLVYNDCLDNNEPKLLELFSLEVTGICSSSYPVFVFGTTGNISLETGFCPVPSSTPTPTPTPSPTYKDPCADLTPTPTPSPTFCPPTPSYRPCPPVPEPACSMFMFGCYPILTYRIVDVCLNQITLDRNTPNFGINAPSCYARTLIYPSKITEIYDSVTPLQHWNENVINYESICGIDEFDVKIWNMNIPWSENPAGLNSSFFKGYDKFGSASYLGTKEYLGYATTDGQNFTSDVYIVNSLDDKVIITPEEQKAIAIVHYTNNTIDNFYGEKFALEPFDPLTQNETSGFARAFKLTLPWLMWHKNPNCCQGQTFWVDPPGFDALDLFKVHYMTSTKNEDMNYPGVRYYNLWDNNPNADGYPSRVGKVFPDSRIVIFDDEEIVAAMSYKSNRNWTLPAPRLNLVTPNTCSNDSGSLTGLLTGDTQYLYVTYRFTNSNTFTNSLHCNYYIKIAGPNSCISGFSQNVGVRFGSEFGCLNQPFSHTTTTTTFSPSTTTTTTMPFVTTTTTVCPPICEVTQGYTAQKFEIICQLVEGNNRPDPDEWKIIDFTSLISGSTLYGYITQDALTATTFVITEENYNSAPYYDLDNYIDLTLATSTGTSLNFGDEYYFYGILETNIQATIYEMRYKVNLSQAEFQRTSNPTWSTNNPSFISEIGLYDSDKNLMIISKLQSPVLRQGTQQFLVKLDF